jgi:hypothetical protein
MATHEQENNQMTRGVNLKRRRGSFWTGERGQVKPANGGSS